jgi:penicillin-binding protein 1A
MSAPLGLHVQAPANSVAPYFIEEVRRQLEKEYGVDEVHGSGLKVYTTLDLDLQMVANTAVLDGVATYERRHGWKGHLQNVVLQGVDAASYVHPDWGIAANLSQSLEKGTYLHGLVTSTSAKRVVVKLGVRQVVLTPPDWKWTGNVDGDSFLKNGDVVYVKVDGVGADGALHATLQEDSGAQASMMAVDNASGEVLAMVGGRDFAMSQFNRATQSQRQVGSSFKPYVYSTAVEAGAKPTDLIVDGPVSFPTPNGPYTPHNYEADYKGTMTLLDAFKESRNIPALKLADRVGIRKVIEMAHRFGVTTNIPAFLPIAIGAADITLYEQVGAYSVFPNDGIRIEPHYIRKVVRADGQQMPEEAPEVKEVISVDTARTMMELLQAVVKSGTGASAGAQMKHPLGGKTGTTNDFTDAWFIGFSPSVTCGTWIGFDDRETLGSKETGAKAALPMWIEFMKVAIAIKPNEAFAEGGEPKKVLDVPLTPAGGELKKAAPDKENVDPDEPGGEGPAKTAPSPAAVAPAPATPAGEGRTGVSSPPPDTN